jgi:hypothetical protein
MANLGSIPALIADADSKVTTNGNGENTGARVNALFNNMIDTLTGSPVVGSSAPQAVFASAAQGQLAQTALQPGSNVSLLNNNANYAAAGSPVSQFNNDASYLAPGANISTLVNNSGYLVPGDNVSALANDAGYITSAPPVLTGNVAYVDAVSGNDSTGAVGNFSLPYATLLAAQTAAVAGTTIVVRPGTYTSASLGKGGVNWLFMLGANVSFTGTSAWRVATINVAYKVRGNGVFTCTGNLAQATQANANIDIECDEATYTRVDQTTGIVKIRINGSAQPTTTSPILGGVLDFSAKSLGFAGTGSAFSVFGGDVTIRDTTIALSGSADYAVLKNSAAGTVALINTLITGGTNSLYANAAAEFSCMNVLADTAVGADVTVIGNMQISSGPAILGDYPIAAADGTWTWSQP